MYQTASKTDTILYTGLFRDIADPILIRKILSRLPDNYVVGEYLNRVIGGSHGEILHEKEVSIELTKSDVSHVLKATYSKKDLEIRLIELTT